MKLWSDVMRGVRRSKRRSGVVSVAVLVIAVALAWFIAAPLPLRGQNSYLVASGMSMLPNIARGDLVVTRKADDYRVGDVVAYRDPTIGAVLHRIIAKEGGRYVLQGDNNDFLDPYRPERSDVMGRMVLHVPGVGKWLARAYEPKTAALLVVGGGMLLASPVAARTVRQERRGRGGAVPGGDPPRRRRMTPGPFSQALALVVGCIALVSVSLALLAYSMPLERGVPTSVDYEHQGEFSYRAEVAGTVYPDGVARTGDPVYRKLAGDMDVRFDYQLTSDAEASAEGTYRLDAVVRMDDGWTRQLTIVEETAFTGTAVAIDGVLSLAAVQAEVDSARAQTGLDSQPLRSYIVDLVPVVDMQATVAEMPVREVFSPRLQLVVEPLVVRVATGGPTAEADVFRPTLTGSLQQRQVVANTIGLPGYNLGVEMARGIAQIGLGMAVAGGLLLIVVIAVASGGDEPSRIKARYGPLLVALRGIDVGDDGRLIELESIEDLAKVAEREGRMILHRECGSVHQYFVQDVDVTYKYQTRPVAVAQRRPGVGRVV